MTRKQREQEEAAWVAIVLLTAAAFVIFIVKPLITQ